MEELNVLLAEARSVTNDILVQVEQAEYFDHESDVRETIQGAVHMGAKVLDLLSEAMDVADSEAMQDRIEAATFHIEDAIDAGQIALKSNEFEEALEDLILRTKDALSLLMSDDIDLEGE